MAEDQTQQQTRVLLVDGQTYILQGDAGDNSINEINEDVLQQALQQATANANNAVEENSQEYITSDAEILQTADNQNFVAILQGEQEHTIQLTLEQAEALGLHFSTDGDTKQEVQDGTLCLPEGTTAQLVYTTASPEDGEEGGHLMFQSEGTSSESITGNTSIAQLVDSESGEIFQTAEGIDYSAVSAFITDDSNQNISLVPQIVNGQVTYTLKIQDDDATQEKLLIRDGSQFSGIIPVQAGTDESTSSLSQTSSTTTSSNITSTATTSSFKAVQEIIEGESDLLTDNKASSVSYVIVPSDESNDSLLLSKPLKSENVVETFQNVSSKSGISDQLASITEGYSTVTAVDTSAPPSEFPDSLPVTTGSLTGIPVAGALQTTNTGLIATGAPVTKFTSILSSANKLLSTSNASTKQPRLVPLTSSTPKMVSINPLTSKVISVNPKPGGKSLLNTSIASKLSSNLTVHPKLSLNTSNLASKLLAPVTTPAPKILAPVASRSINPSVTKTVSPPSVASKLATTDSAAATTVNTNSLLNKVNTNAVSSGSSKLITVSSPNTKLLSVPTTTINRTPAAISNAVNAALQKTTTASKTNTSKPLGSSENPIQLVQHGQTFHSMQTLSQSQLRQIATVLKQQNLDTTPRTKNVLYDPETKTRIIYRVVYPEDLDLQDPKSPDMKGYIAGRGRGKRGRPPKYTNRTAGGRNSVDLDLDEDRLLDDTSKSEKKKHLPRTRSGRLSRPPRHMMKDYKRLHHLDFADADLDDSDGGYSDYQISDVEEEPEKPEKEEPLKDLSPGLMLPKRKISSHFRCPKCQKIYLGHRRMARHFEVFPDHGSIDQFETPKKEPAEEKLQLNQNGLIRSGPGRRRGRRRGWTYLTPEARSQRRKLKLQEALASCEPSEITEICGSSVAGVLSLWDLLLLRIDSVQTGESYVATLCDELLALLEKVRSITGDILLPLSPEEKEKGNENHIEMQDEYLCRALGLSPGLYKADDHALRSKKRSLPFSEESASKHFKGNEDDDEDEEEEEDEDHMGEHPDKMKEDCPELLTALTLVANANTSKTTTPISGSSKVHFVDEMSIGLSEDSSDITLGPRMRLDSATEQQSKESLQTVDEIVNESLKNMNFHSSAIVSHHISHETEDSKSNMSNEYSVLNHSGDDASVSSFDPEIALAAMGEGSQHSDRQTERHFKIVNQADDLDTSFDAEAAFADLEKSQLVEDTSKCESFPTLTCIAQSVAASLPRTFVDSVVNAPSFDSSQTLVTVSSTVSEHKDSSVTVVDNTHLPVNYDSDNQLVAIKDGNTQEDSSKPVEGSIQDMKMDVDLVSDVTTSDANTDTTSCKNNIISSCISADNYSFQSLTIQSNFHTETSLINEQTEDQNRNEAVVITPNFTPEMALAAMGEGEEGASKEESESTLNISQSSETSSSFDPEAALAAMGEGEQEDSRNYSNSERQNYQLQCTSEQDFIEVGLGEGTTDLVFEALGEEFTDNSQHR